MAHSMGGDQGKEAWNLEEPLMDQHAWCVWCEWWWEGGAAWGDRGQNRNRQVCSIWCVCFILSAMGGPRGRALHDHIPLWNDLGRMKGRLGNRRVENS